MKFNFYYNAKVIKLFVVILSISFSSQISISQEDPIKDALQKEKQDYLGVNLNEAEAEELKSINTKYALNEKETELRSKERSGQKIGLFDKFRLAKANRKDYMRAKKFEQFKEKKMLSKQSESTKKRMIENKKQADKKYMREKKRKKRKSFFNLFR